MRLLEHLENGSRWKLDNGLHRLVLDGSINCRPWDGADEVIRPQRLVMDEAFNANGGKALYAGRFAYWTDLMSSEVRVYPVRGDTSKYILVGSVFPAPLSVNQRHDKYIELFYEQPDGKVRWSFIISDTGFKTNIKVRKGYAGNGEFSLRFELVGLQRDGRRVYDRGVLVCELPNPFAVDGNSEIHEVVESVNSGVITLGVDIKDPIWDIDIDPQLGPVQPNKDTYLDSGAPTTGNGGSSSLTMNGSSSTRRRPLYLWDISSILGNNVVSSDLSLFVWSAVGGAVGKSFSINRCTRTNWDENSGLNFAANWTNYLTAGPVPWTVIGGDFTKTDAANGLTYPGGAGFFTYSIIALTQDAIDNRAGLLSLLQFYDDETTGVNSNVSYRSREYFNSAERPKLVVDYTPKAIAPPHLFKRVR
jgi:hypothetical protein